MADVEIEAPRLSRADYERLAESGALRPEERTELVSGRIYPMTPQSSWHAATVHLLMEALRPCLSGQSLRIQAPLALDEGSEPEPDLAVVAGAAGDYLAAHPSSALLVVEVAHRSLRHDRGRKLPVYAAAGIPEVWILSFEERCLDVYREPEGGKYLSHSQLRAGERITPGFAPSAAIDVGELLPASS